MSTPSSANKKLQKPLPSTSSSLKTEKPSTFSKWAKLKTVLQNKTSLESSVNLLRTKTIEQFSSECHKIYKKKIKIQYIQENNRQIISSSKKHFDFKLPEITTKDAKTDLTYSDWIEQFLFKFRSNNSLMLTLIDCLNQNQSNILVPFLCHFFYENFYSESTEQEEILYIIYLLLEKEINNLYTPSIYSFLNNTFLGKFLLEFANRYEIKCYIKQVINNLIQDLERMNGEYEKLDIIEGLKEYEMQCKYMKKYPHNNNNNDSNANENKLNKNLTMYNETNRSMQDMNDKSSTPNPLNIKKFMKAQTLDERLHEDYKPQNDYTENTLRNELKNSMNNPLKKDIIIKHLRLCRNAKMKDLFSFSNYLNEIRKKNDSNVNILNELIDKHNKGIKTVQDVIINLFNNLDNETIIPYSIKCICKIIYTLIQKKFEKLSRFEINIFLCEFLLGKLILPVLINPDINELGCDVVVTMTTRKNCFNIYRVLKKISRGELFTSENDPQFTIFNHFIISQVCQLSQQLDKFTKVNLPPKLEKLMNMFSPSNINNTGTPCLEAVNINYDYFEENPNDFMQHQSICFQLKELITIIDVVNRNEKKFIGQGFGSEFEVSYKSLNEFKDFFQRKLTNTKGRDYYVIINDIFTPDKQQLLTTKETVVKLPAIPVDEIKELKYAITFLLSKMELRPHSDWIIDDLPTVKCFDSIYKIIQCYESNNNEKSIPLYWYGLYILNKLEKIPSKYKENDYQLLYNEIMKETENTIISLKELNDFLTIQVTSKFWCLQQKIKITKQTLDKIRTTELNIKTLKFIETQSIPVCVMSMHELRKIKTALKDKEIKDDVNADNKEILVEKQQFCLHSTKKIANNAIVCNETSHYHCNSIDDFANKLKTYNEIYEDIYEGSHLTKTDEVLNSYLNAVKEELCKHKDFIIDVNTNQLRTLPNDNDEEQLVSWSELYQKKALDMIKSYILKQLAINPIIKNKFHNADSANYSLCKTYSFLDPIENLNIPKTVFNNEIFNLIVMHMKIMDQMKTPQEIMNEFGIAVGLMSNLISFTTGNQAQADDLIALTVYAIITAQPQNLIWNTKYTRYFLSENDKMTDLGYNLTQINTSVEFIKNINEKVVHMDKERFSELKMRNLSSNV